MSYPASFRKFAERTAKFVQWSSGSGFPRPARFILVRKRSITNTNLHRQLPAESYANYRAFQRERGSLCLVVRLIMRSLVRQCAQSPQCAHPWSYKCVSFSQSICGALSSQPRRLNLWDALLCHRNLLFFTPELILSLRRLKRKCCCQPSPTACIKSWCGTPVVGSIVCRRWSAWYGLNTR